MVVVKENTNVGSAIVEVLTPLTGDALAGTRGVIELIMTESDIKAFEVIFKDGVHHAGYRVSTVDRRCTVAKHFNSINTPHRNMV